MNRGCVLAAAAQGLNLTRGPLLRVIPLSVIPFLVALKQFYLIKP